MTQQRKLAAIMFTDIVGYTAMMSRDERKALELLLRNREVVKSNIRECRGEWLKEIGDGTLSCFASAVDAVNCALSIQRTLESEPDLRLRIGIHVADIVYEDGDVFGDGVNVASRLQELADPGSICVSERVAEEIRNQRSMETSLLGDKALEGVGRPIRAYAVTGTTLPPAGAERSVLHAFAGRRWGMPAAAVALLALAAALWFHAGRDTGGPPEPGFQPRLGDRSVAVLPFVNFSDDKVDEYFSDGVTEDIIAQLSKVADLRVISRTSTMRYKHRSKSTREIAEELGVAAVLEGSVRRDGNRVRIVSQLIDARTDEHIWSDTFDRDLTDIFSVQSAVARHIAGALRATLSVGERMRIERRPTESTEAYTLYLKGRFLWNERTEEAILKAKAYFEQATEKDPLYAQAFAGLADCYSLLHQYAGLPPGDTFPKARAAALRALQIDPDIAEAHTSLAYALQEYYWDWTAAEQHHLRAMELNPNYATGHHWYGEYLMRFARLDEALEEILKAQELDPLSIPITSFRCAIHLVRGEYDQALEQNNRILEMASDWPLAYLDMALIYEAMDRPAEAADWWGRYFALKGFAQEEVSIMQTGFQRSGTQGFWEAYLRLARRGSKKLSASASEFAMAYARLGDKDSAFGWLEKAHAERGWELPYIKSMGPAFWPGLKGDPRYDDLMRRMRLF